MIDLDNVEILFFYEILFMIEINSNKKVDLESSGRNKKFKIALKHWTGTIIIGGFAVIVVFGLLRGREFLANFLLSREQERIQKELERPYREDKYGGKTPEETFDMFLAALKKGDIDLASKYFVLRKQDNFLEMLRDYKDDVGLDKLVSDLEGLRAGWRLVKNDGIEALYEYEYFLDTKDVRDIPIGGGKVEKIEYNPGKYIARARFEKNTFSNVWKLVEI